MSERLPVAVARVVDGVIVYANAAAAKLMKVPAPKLVGRSLFDFVAPEDYAAISEMYEARRQGRRVADAFVTHVLLEDGERILVDVCLDSRGTDLVAVLRPLGEQTRDRALVMALSQATSRVQSARTSEEILEVAGTVARELGMQMCALRVEDSKAVVVHVAASAATTEQVEAVIGRSVIGMRAPIGPGGVIRRALDAKGPFFASDLRGDVLRYLVGLNGGREDPRFAPLIARADLGAGVFVPVFLYGEPWGVLGFISDTLGEPDAAALALFGAEVTSALEVVENLAYLEKRNQDIAAIHAVATSLARAPLHESLPQLLAVAAEATATDAVALHLLDQPSGALVLAGIWGYRGPLEQRYARMPVLNLDPKRLARPRARDIRDLPPPLGTDLADAGFRQAGVVPLMLGSREVGLLSLGRKSDRAYTPEELRAAEILGSQVAVQVENAQLYSETRRRVDLLSSLFRITQMVTGTTGLEPMLGRVLEELVRTLGIDIAVVHLREGEVVRCKALRSPDPALRIPHRLEQFPAATDSVLANALRTGETAVVRVAGEVPRETRQNATDLRIDHLVCAPMSGGAGPLGVLTAGRRGERPFDREEVQLLETAAAHLGVAVEHEQFFEERRRRADELAALHEIGNLINQHLELPAVLDAGVRNLARISQVKSVLLMLLDEDRQTLRTVATTVEQPAIRSLALPMDGTAAAVESVRRREPVIYNELAGMPETSRGVAGRFAQRSVMAVPLLSRGQPIGCIALSDGAPNRFAAADVQRVVLVANQLSTAITNARLFGEQRSRVEELQVLLDVGRLITGSLELERILSESAVQLARFVSATDSFMWLIEPGTRMMRGAATTTPAHLEHFRRVRVSIDDQSAAGEAIRTRRVVRVRHGLTSNIVNQEINQRYQMKSLLALPLMVRGEPVGAAVVSDALRERDWTEAEVERATIIAGQVAVAIHNARLFEDLKRSYEQLNRTQQELVKRERLAALGELAAVVAHEVRNPLGVIFNSLGPLRKALTPGSNGAMLLDIVGEEADRLNRIVGDLLDFAKPLEPSLLAEPLEPILTGARDATHSAAEAANVKVELRLAPGLPELRGDARMLRQAFVNLLTNAVQAMPRGGEVTVSADAETHGDRPGLKVRVQDTGPGIPADMADRIFQPFFTTKASGTGLGLAVVKRIVERHGGEITVHSEAGHGAAFVLWLPSDREAAG